MLRSCSHLKVLKLTHLKQFFEIIDFRGEAFFTDTDVRFPKNKNYAFCLTKKSALRLLATFKLLSNVKLIWLRVCSSNTKLFLFSHIFLLKLYREPMLVTDPPQMEHNPHAKPTTQQPNTLIEIIENPLTLKLLRDRSKFKSKFSLPFLSKLQNFWLMFSVAMHSHLLKENIHKFEILPHLKCSYNVEQHMLSIYLCHFKLFWLYAWIM